MGYPNVFPVRSALRVDHVRYVKLRHQFSTAAILDFIIPKSMQTLFKEARKDF